jgi:O-antigen ligase
MALSDYRLFQARPSVSLVLLTGFLVILWLAGGASRENVPGQFIVRAAAWCAIIVAVLFARRPVIGDARAPALFLLSMIILCAAQLLPLPPSLWQSMPGRKLFGDPIISDPELWRPLSLVPGATINAFSSLVIPAAVLLLMCGLKEDRRFVPAALLSVISCALLIGLLQFTGIQIKNPFVNSAAGSVDGLFANRNHFALLLSFGLVVAPAWAFGDGQRSPLKAQMTLGLVALLVLAILATGSRAGILLAMMGFAAGTLISRRGIAAALRRYPRWVLPVCLIGFAALLALFVWASFVSGRAASIDRAFEVEAGEDSRTRALPTVMAITRTYFPVGSGLGSFDPIFRVHEPLSLLKPTYFNHAHNDLVEVVLTAGLPGLLLLLTALGWWFWISARAWRTGEQKDAALAKAGSMMLLMTFVASAFDYPARTPFIMAIVVIAAIWLSGAPGKRSALRSDSQGL